MASVFKRSRWIDAAGRKCRKDAPGAKRVKSDTWMIRIQLDGRPVLLKGFTDKGATEAKAADLEKQKARGETGLIDVYKAHRARPLVEHIADWTTELRALGRDDDYIAPCKARMERLAVECNWTGLRAITADTFCKWRETAMGNADHNRVEKAGRTIRTMSPRSKNHYLATLTTFCRWCVKRHRMESNPVVDVEKVDESKDVRRERRALSVDDLNALLDAVPAHYRIGYQLLMGTGLRRSELLALRWGDVKLNAPLPFIQLRAGDTKSKRADVLPLRADLADVLRKAKGDADEGETVVKVLPRIPTHRRYLAAAGIAWLDDAGRRADIHCLRHSYGTLLSKGGVSPREAMSLMRHTDLRLTMKTYTDPRIFDLAGAVAKLPMHFGTSTDAGESAKATGTDCKPLLSGRTESVTSPQAGIGYCSASIGKPGDRGEVTLPLATGGDRQQTAGNDGEEKRAGDGIRTHDVSLGKAAFCH